MRQIKEHIEAIEKLDTNVIKDIIKLIVDTFNQDNKILIVGNGGSAADAQHIAAEFVNRFKIDRKALPAIALTTDSSALTSIANDFSYDQVFSRQIEGLGNKGDVLIAISTSGNSKNVIKAIETAKEKMMKVVSFIGSGGEQKGLGDIDLLVNCNDTARIQEAHQLAYHIICEEVEKCI